MPTLADDNLRYEKDVDAGYSDLTGRILDEELRGLGREDIEIRSSDVRLDGAREDKGQRIYAADDLTARTAITDADSVHARVGDVEAVPI